MSERDGDRKKQEGAFKELQAGRDARIKGDFYEALKHFSKALELDNEDIQGITTDRLMLYFTMGKYNECIADCIRAEERGRKLNVNAELRAMVLRIKGSAYLKLAKCAKDYNLAIEALDSARKMHVNQDTLRQLDHARKEKKELEIREYCGDQERDLGNKLYIKNRTEAVRHYTEAIKLNPCDAKAYGNRAYCYTLDGMLAEGLADAEKCLALDPTYVKGYLRKGNIEFEKKEYNKALKTYEMGLKHDEENKELLDRISQCCKQMQLAAEKGDTVIKSYETLKEKQANALLDPEIQSILSDPIMRQVLIDLQQNPSDAQEHVQNKLVMGKVLKLSEAGLL